MAEPLDSHSARNEALSVLRPLVMSEETRSANLNTRALGVISASSVVTAIAAFFAKDVLSGSSLERLGESKALAVLVLMFAVAALAVTVLCGVWTLWPRSRDFIEPDGLNEWAQSQQDGMNEALIREQTLADLAGYLGNLRSFNGAKVARLRITYVLYAVAVAAIALDAGLFFYAAL